MMSGDREPPGGERPGPTAETGPNQKSADTTTDRPKVTAQPRLCRRNVVGRHADAWREGFAYGFCDALRLAQREVDDPHVWLTLSRLADRYAHLGTLAGDAATGGETR